MENIITIHLELEKKAMGYMRIGIERQARYKHTGNKYNPLTYELYLSGQGAKIDAPMYLKGKFAVGNHCNWYELI